MKRIVIVFVGLLLVVWNGVPKNELLEETLYTRYHSYLDQTYSDFILCPKIDKIERIEGDTRRHIVNAGALNYCRVTIKLFNFKTSNTYTPVLKLGRG